MFKKYFYLLFHAATLLNVMGNRNYDNKVYYHDNDNEIHIKR